MHRVTADTEPPHLTSGSFPGRPLGPLSLPLQRPTSEAVQIHIALLINTYGVLRVVLSLIFNMALVRAARSLAPLTHCTMHYFFLRMRVSRSPKEHTCARERPGARAAHMSLPGAHSHRTQQ